MKHSYAQPIVKYEIKNLSLEGIGMKNLIDSYIRIYKKIYTHQYEARKFSHFEKNNILRNECVYEFDKRMFISREKYIRQPVRSS